MDLIGKIADKYSLDLLLLFGSRAEGKAHDGSDFDVAYLSRRNLGLLEEATLIIDLAPLFKSDNIDLVNLKKAPPLLYYAIFKKPQVLHEDRPLLFFSLRSYAFKKFVEAKPLYRAKFARVQKQLANLWLFLKLSLRKRQKKF